MAYKPKVLTVPDGGSGAATLTGLVLGNGAGAFTADTYTAVTTWTPAIKFGGASIGVTYTQQQGWYARIGNVVYITMNMVLSSKGSSTGQATITGLPVVHGATNQVSTLSSLFINVTLSLTQAYIQSDAIIIVNQSSGGNITAIQDTAIQNTSQIYCNGYYFIT